MSKSNPLKAKMCSQGGGGDSHTKRKGGCLSEILKRSPNKVPRSCFIGVAFNFFKPQENLSLLFGILPRNVFSSFLFSTRAYKIITMKRYKIN